MHDHRSTSNLAQGSHTFCVQARTRRGTSAGGLLHVADRRPVLVAVHDRRQPTVRQPALSGRARGRDQPRVHQSERVADHDPERDASRVGHVRCRVAPRNFTVSQQLTATPTVPANSTKSLQDLGVAQADWPQLQMIGSRQPGRLSERHGRPQPTRGRRRDDARDSFSCSAEAPIAVVLATVVVTGLFVSGADRVLQRRGCRRQRRRRGRDVGQPGTPRRRAPRKPGRSVTLTWSAATLANGQPVDGYLVTRYEADPPYRAAAHPGRLQWDDHRAHAAPSTPSRSGAGSTRSRPLKGDNWRGLESPKSGTVTIGAASLTLDQSALGLADFDGGFSHATLTGSLTGFASNEGITFKLDDPSAGSTLSGSPASADGSGDASRLDHAAAAERRAALDLRRRRRRAIRRRRAPRSWSTRRRRRARRAATTAPGTRATSRSACRPPTAPAAPA